MSAQKPPTVFGEIMSVASPTSTSLSPFQSQQTLTRSEQRALEQARLDGTVITAQTAIGEFAARKIAELEYFAAATYTETSRQIFALRDQAQSDDHSRYVQAFTELRAQSLGNNLDVLVKLGDHRINEVVERSKYPEPEPPKRGWFSR